MTDEEFSLIISRCRDDVTGVGVKQSDVPGAPAVDHLENRDNVYADGPVQS